MVLALNLFQLHTKSKRISFVRNYAMMATALRREKVNRTKSWWISKIEQLQPLKENTWFANSIARHPCDVWESFSCRTPKTAHSNYAKNLPLHTSILIRLLPCIDMFGSKPDIHTYFVYLRCASLSLPRFTWRACWMRTCTSRCLITIFAKCCIWCTFRCTRVYQWHSGQPTASFWVKGTFPQSFAASEVVGRLILPLTSSHSAIRWAGKYHCRACFQ